MIHPPWMQIIRSDTGEVIHTASEAPSRAVIAQLAAANVAHQTTRYRGLAGLDRELLTQSCIDPETRKVAVLSDKDAQMAIEVFGGNLSE